MADNDFEKILEELKKQLDCTKQNWLFGAGISCDSNIPLMFQLTERVKKIISDSGHAINIQIYNLLINELEEKAHIEHYLSHLGDLIALADRCKSKKSSIEKTPFSKDELLTLHKSIITAIGETVRYGYIKKDNVESIGTPQNPIVEIENHIKFVQAINSNRTNLLSRSKLTFFTTNYDTLLEDALSIEKFTVVDGFSGGAVGYWNPQFEFQDSNSFPNKCLLYKLHGSIDWQRDERNSLIRTRYGTKYLDSTGDIMIYPQATKYVETQKDPFSYLFSGFRNVLNTIDDNVLITCGYSFGDDHINAEIESALSSKINRTTLLAFAKENPEDGIVVNKTLDLWLTDKNFGNRVYVAGQKGIYYNSLVPIQPDDSKDLHWWTFSGLTTFISTGENE